MPIQAGIPGQYRRFEFTELAARIDAELFGEGLWDPPVDGQGLGLSTRTEQADHELSLQALVQRVTGHQDLEFGDQLGVPTQVQIRLHP